MQAVGWTKVRVLSEVSVCWSVQHVELAGWAGIQARGKREWRGGREGAPVDASAPARGEPEQIAMWEGLTPRAG